MLSMGIKSTGWYIPIWCLGVGPPGDFGPSGGGVGTLKLLIGCMFLGRLLCPSQCRGRLVWPSFIRLSGVTMAVGCERPVMDRASVERAENMDLIFKQNCVKIFELVQIFVDWQIQSFLIFLGLLLFNKSFLLQIVP
jgi:hypothetical protein